MNVESGRLPTYYTKLVFSATVLLETNFCVVLLPFGVVSVTDDHVNVP